MVGGNIRGYTRTMTTSIALETSRGDLALALGLGLVLVSLTLVVSAAAFGISRWRRCPAGDHCVGIVPVGKNSCSPLILNEAMAARPRSEVSHSCQILASAAWICGFFDGFTRIEP